MVRVILYSFTMFLLCMSCQSDTKATGSDTDQNKKELVVSNETEFTKKISPSEFLAEYADHPGAMMIDVRTPKEFVSGRIVPEAENVDYHGDDFLQKILSYDRDAPVFIYCFSGGRSTRAAFKMRQLGFKQIYECDGGYQRWESENKK